MNTKTIIRRLAAVITFGIATIAGTGIYFYHIAIARSNKDFLWDGEEQTATEKEKRTNDGIHTDKDWMKNANFELLELLSDDGIKLKAYYFKLHPGVNKTVILAHGYSLNSTAMEAFARFYSETLAYNVLIPDARGHGSSEGNYIGFGWPERKDCKKWINLLISKQGSDAQIILHGVSMGGATVLMTSGEKLPSNVKAIISDCAYTSAEDQLSYQLKIRYGLPSFPFIPAVSAVSKIKAGYTLREASVLTQVKHARVPILFIHGESDDFVPYEMVNRLYNACTSEKKLFTVKGADHANAYNVDREGYQNAVCTFLDKYIQ